MTEAKSGSSDGVSCDHMRKGLAALSSEREQYDLCVGAPLCCRAAKILVVSMRSLISFGHS